MATSSTEGGPWTPREVVCRKSWLFEPNRTRMRAPLGRGGAVDPQGGHEGRRFAEAIESNPLDLGRRLISFFSCFSGKGGRGPPWVGPRVWSMLEMEGSGMAPPTFGGGGLSSFCLLFPFSDFFLTTYGFPVLYRSLLTPATTTL